MVRMALATMDYENSMKTVIFQELVVGFICTLATRPTIFHNCRFLSKGALSSNIALILTMKQPNCGPSLIKMYCVYTDNAKLERN